MNQNHLTTAGPRLLVFAWIALTSVSLASADDIALIPEKGKLEALNDMGQVIGPCPLQHTDVQVEVSGPFARVNVRQSYHNPYDVKIEAVYTFPMGDEAAVHSMQMTVGDHVVIAEIKEREEARRIYEQAKQDNHITSLLEQERPNIFTQSVANIEPGARIDIEISYLEPLDFRDGVYSFTFPTVVGPRYIPGSPTVSRALVPAELQLRHKPVLLAPGTIRTTRNDPGNPITAGKIKALLTAAIPIQAPPDFWWGVVDGQVKVVPPLYSFSTIDCNGEQEFGIIFPDGTGQIKDRWFFTDFDVLAGMGNGFVQNTDQVPDASRITPMPVKPSTRAGHDISISVDIDIVKQFRDDDGLVTRAVVALANQTEIPNRDFTLRWRTSGTSIEEGILAHADADLGRFFTLIVQPPDRVAPEMIRPRELIFVLDTSGSMSGEPIEKAKEVMTRAIGAMRQGDTFNVVTFAGSTQVLWPQPRPNTAENRRLATELIEGQSGGGGTEMMTAINAALAPNWAADDDHPHRIVMFLTDGQVGNDHAIIAAVQRHADTTRVFSFGVGNAPNRYLLDGMANAARGAADYVSLEGDADEVIQRFTRRIESPVLTDISLEFSPNLGVSDIVPMKQNGLYDDLYDVTPIIVHGMYAAGGEGTVTIHGLTGAGPYKRTVDVVLPDGEPRNRAIASVWARERIGMLMERDLDGAQQGEMEPVTQAAITSLGLRFGLLTQFTSFVAVDKLRKTIDGEPVLIDVPVELPEGTEWKGFFNEQGQPIGRSQTALALNMPAQETTIGGSGGGGVGGGGGYGGGGFGRGGGGGGGFVGGGGGGGGSVFADPGDPDDQISEEELADELIDVIINLIEREEDAETWDILGGSRASIRFYKGVLIIRGPDYIQRQVEDLLSDLRKNRAESALMAQSPDAIAYTIVDLLEEGRIIAATRMTTWAQLHHPELPIGSLIDAFIEKLPLEETQTEAAFKQLRLDVEQAIRAGAQATRRSQLIRGRVDQRLWYYALDDALPTSFDPRYIGERPKTADWVDGGIRILIRLLNTEAPTLEALKTIDLRIEDVSQEYTWVIGTLPLGRLDDAALLTEVRQIVPYRKGDPLEGG